MSDSSDRLRELLTEIRDLAREYRQVTGRPLGITGEIAEIEAARLLGLELAPVRQAGYDATRNGVERLQIKGRCLLDNSKPGQRVGGIQLSREWDGVILVLLDADYDAVEIYEAGRAAITEALLAPGSKARNERGALSVSKFKSIGTKLWSRAAIKTDETHHQTPDIRSELPMPQNRDTGAAGNDYGHANAKRIATALGATLTRPGSNEAMWKDKKAVIKSARVNTSSVGVTYSMLEYLDVILAAFQQRGGGYHVYAMPAARFAELAVDSRSSGNGARVGIVTKAKFLAEAQRIASVAG